MEIVYRSGKFCFKGDDGYTEYQSHKTLGDFIDASRLMAGDVGEGKCISRTPESEFAVLEMAAKCGQVIQCEGIYRSAAIYVEPYLPSTGKGERIGSVETRIFPLDNINYGIYRELVYIEAARWSSAEELYRVTIQEHRLVKGHWHIDSTAITQNVKAATWAAKKGIKI